MRSLMNLIKIALATLAFTETFAVMTAHADSRFYLGGGVGRTKIQDSAQNPQGCC